MLRRSQLTPTQLAVLEAEGTDEDHELVGSPPELMLDEPQALDLFLRLRRAVPSDQPISFGSALELQTLLYGPPADVALFLDDLDAMDDEFHKHQAKPARPESQQVGKRKG